MVGGNRRVRAQEKRGGKWEKWRKILQHFVIFHNRNETNKEEPLQKGVGSESKRYGKWEWKIQEVQGSNTIPIII